MATALLRRGASVHTKDETWDGTPLLWALYAWRNRTASGERYHEIVRTLLRSGAPVEPEMLNDEAVRADPTMLELLSGG